MMDLLEISAGAKARKNAMRRKKKKNRPKNAKRRMAAKKAARRRSKASRAKAAKRASKTRKKRWGKRRSILGWTELPGDLMIEDEIDEAIDMVAFAAESPDAILEDLLDMFR